jgi:hypothetical protein
MYGSNTNYPYPPQNNGGFQPARFSAPTPYGPSPVMYNHQPPSGPRPLPMGPPRNVNQVAPMGSGKTRNFCTTCRQETGTTVSSKLNQQGWIVCVILCLCCLPCIWLVCLCDGMKDKTGKCVNCDSVKYVRRNR